MTQLSCVNGFSVYIPFRDGVSELKLKKNKEKCSTWYNLYKNHKLEKYESEDHEETMKNLIDEESKNINEEPSIHFKNVFEKLSSEVPCKTKDNIGCP